MRLIDADELKEEMNKKALDLANGGMIFIENINKVIDNTPTVETKTIMECILAYGDGYESAKRLYERPQGEWVYTDKEDKEKGYGGYCSICKCDMPIGMNDWKQEYYESKFCPNCGADMRKGGAE